MNSATAFIWDLDGTLLDSYDVIVDSLYKAFRIYDIEFEKEQIMKEVMTSSVNSFLEEIENMTGVNAVVLKKAYSEFSEQDTDKIRPMKDASMILGYIKERGISNYVFTHRGASTEYVLKNTGLYGFFDEIITGESGFGRKPDPGAIKYLVQKHHLDREGTFYVGDRRIDMECAYRANIRSILYIPENGVITATGIETYVVRNLSEIQAYV